MKDTLKVWNVELTWRGSTSFHAYSSYTVIATNATAAYEKVERKRDENQKRTAFISKIELIAEASR